ncbi:transposase, partial [Heliobacillus mobilis]
GWSDGHSFLPIDFSLLSSQKVTNRIGKMNDAIDKRTHGYKRRMEALQSAPERVVAMIKAAFDSGVAASYVLMDSWFTQLPLIQQLVGLGIDVIGMVKPLKQRYSYQGKRYTLAELYVQATVVRGHSEILRSIIVELTPGLKAKIVFVTNRNKRNEWLAILSTEHTLNEQEIVRIYGMRWEIETFFKCSKSFLRLAKEFQGRSYDALISHTTIVFSRYIMLSWQHRTSTDPRTLGGIFYECCDEVNDLEWAVALQQLWSIIDDVVKNCNK